MSAPIVTIDPNSLTANLYDPIEFICSAVGLGDFSYAWESSSNIVHTNERSLTIDSALPRHQGQYKCTVTSSYSNLTSEAFATLKLKGIYNGKINVHGLLTCLP